MPVAQAAKEETPVFLLAAGVRPELTANSHRGHQLPTSVLYPGIGSVNSNTALGLHACLYDSGRRSRSTGKERDAESGLDWFKTRYFSGAQGRFTSPDEPPNDQESSDPQSWNLYSYVRNNPLKFIDPRGRDCVYLNGSGTGVGSIDNQTNAGHCGNNGGYWVEGTVTGAQIGPNSVSLTGTTNGTNVTNASYDIAPDPGLMALQEAGNRAGRDLSTSAIIMGGTAAAIATVSVAPLAYAALPVGSEAGILVLGGKALELARNASGKIKGSIEEVRAIVYRMSPEQLRQAAEELRQSIQVRSQELLRLGEDPGMGWKRWSTRWIHGTLGLFNDYRLRRPPLRKAVTVPSAT